jgi:hypothetical protein
MKNNKGKQQHLVPTTAQQKIKDILLNSNKKHIGLLSIQLIQLPVTRTPYYSATQLTCTQIYCHCLTYMVESSLILYKLCGHKDFMSLSKMAKQDGPMFGNF